jgi:hypothetical protein
MTAFSLADHAAGLEARIRAHRPLNLAVPWADELVYPNYHGLSIRNLPHTVAHLLGAPLPGSTPLDAGVWDQAPLPDDIDRVVVIVSDGLSYRWLNAFMADDSDLAQAVGDLTEGRGPVPLTSVCPSTTGVALPCLWTGSSAAAHGMTSFLVFLREYSQLTIPLFFAPATRPIQRDALLAQRDLDPAAFVPVRGLADHLNAHGVPTYPFLRHDYMDSGISRVLHRGVRDEHKRTHRNSYDMWLRLRELLAETRGQRCYINVYWPGVDDVSHYYGADTRYARHEVAQQLADLRDLLADESLRDGRTLFMLTADHGHHDVLHTLNLQEDPRARPIFDALRLQVAGETRLPYLYVEAAQRDAVIDTIETHYADIMTWVDAQDALAAGLFGTEPPYAETRYRLGDLVLIPRLGWRVIDGWTPPPPLISVHGGLSDWEMLVPLLWRRL